MNPQRPTTFDELASITMLHQAEGTWWTNVTNAGGETIMRFEGADDPCHAMELIAGELLKNSGTAHTPTVQTPNTRKLRTGKSSQAPSQSKADRRPAQKPQSRARRKPDR